MCRRALAPRPVEAAEPGFRVDCRLSNSRVKWHLIILDWAGHAVLVVAMERLGRKKPDAPLSSNWPTTWDFV